MENPLYSIWNSSLPKWQGNIKKSGYMYITDLFSVQRNQHSTVKQL